MHSSQWGLSLLYLTFFCSYELGPMIVAKGVLIFQMAVVLRQILIKSPHVPGPAASRVSSGPPG